MPLIFFLTVYLLMHFYIYYDLIKDFDISCRKKYFILIFLLAGYGIFVFDKLVRKHFLLLPFNIYGAYWFGIFSITFSVFILKDIFLLILPVKKTKILKKNIAVISIIIIIILSFFGIIIGRKPPVLKALNIKVNGLEQKYKGFSIVHVSDFHLDRMKSNKWLSNIVDKINVLKPDLIVITGDIIDDFTKTNDYIFEFNRLKSRYGVYAVTGNHEYYKDIEKFSKIISKTQIKMLRNENVTLNNGIQLIGVDDNTGKKFGEKGSDLKKAFYQIKKDVFSIFLTHKPLYYKEAQKNGVSLMLAGHTHNGQIIPYNILIKFLYKFSYGFYKYKDMNIYTSSGVGTWSFSMRLFSRSEIVKIVLS